MSRSTAAGDAKIAFGAWLRREREDRGLPLDVIADITRLPRSRLEALEDGRWEAFGAAIYVRGAIRAYAQAIGLDPDEALLKLQADGLSDDYAQPWPDLVRCSHPLFRGERPASPVRLGRMVTMLALVGVLAGAFAGLIALNQMPLVETAPEASDPPPAAREVSTPASVTALGLPAADPAGTESVPPPVHRLAIKARDEVWMQLSFDGGTTREMILPAGRDMMVEATSSIDLLVGNAGGLILRVDDGRPFALGVSGQVRRRIFRFDPP